MDVHGELLRGLILLVVAGCAPPDWSELLEDAAPLDVAHAFVGHRSFRMAALERSLRDPVRGYGTLRLERYGSDWERVPVYNPTALPEEVPGDLAALRELGRRAFTAYPIQPSRQWQGAAEHGADGMDADTFVTIPGPDGPLPAQTCATCHSAQHDGIREWGRPNSALELGPDHGAAWPTGTVDPTPDGVDNPTTVGDLRPIRHQAALHWAGTLHNSLPALAVRIDTLLITSQHQQSRAPRVVPVAIAAWLWSLADALPEPPVEGHGADVFADACARCHDHDHLADPVPVDVVGTDSAATDSPTRGTGHYRVPSLRGVATRGPFLHDGSMPSLDHLWDEQRAGHRFGEDLPPEDQDALLDYLRAL